MGIGGGLDGNRLDPFRVLGEVTPKRNPVDLETKSIYGQVLRCSQSLEAEED